MLESERPQALLQHRPICRPIISAELGVRMPNELRTAGCPHQRCPPGVEDDLRQTDVPEERRLRQPPPRGILIGLLRRYAERCGERVVPIEPGHQGILDELLLRFARHHRRVVGVAPFSKALVVIAYVGASH